MISNLTASQLRSIAPALINQYNEASMAYKSAHRWLAQCSIGNCIVSYNEAHEKTRLARTELVRAEMAIESALGVSHSPEVIDAF
jgi:hypothetical protein